jgi:hypothetical protein
MWSPVQQLTILGYFINTENHFISIPEERLLKVFKTINLIEYNLEKFSKVNNNTIVIDFDLTLPGLEPTIYCSRDEHV